MYEMCGKMLQQILPLNYRLWPELENSVALFLCKLLQHFSQSRTDNFYVPANTFSTFSDSSHPFITHMSSVTLHSKKLIYFLQSLPSCIIPHLKDLTGW